VNKLAVVESPPFLLGEGRERVSGFARLATLTRRFAPPSPRGGCLKTVARRRTVRKKSGPMSRRSDEKRVGSESTP
jgi:hypothetical protein